MRKTLIVVLVMALAFLVCVPSTLIAKEPGGVAGQETVVQGNTELAVELYQLFAEDGGSFVFSPCSVYTLLALLHGGARGETAAQIETALGLPAGGGSVHTSLPELQQSLVEASSSEGIDLLIANAVWPQERYDLLPDYVDLVEGYGAEVTPLDYGGDAGGSQRAINSWAAENTNHRITRILDNPLHPATLFAMTNAILFKGEWESQFDPGATTEQPFHGQGGTTTVDLMDLEQVLPTLWFQDVHLLELPFVDDRFSMVFVLPAGETTFAGLERALTADAVETHPNQMYETLMRVYLPRFSIESEFDLVEPFRGLGMARLLQNGAADLSGIDGVPYWLYLGFALQKAFVEVNEEGAEGAAVTIGGGCFPAGTPVLTPQGPRLIEELTGGDLVIARNMDGGSWTAARVSGTTVQPFRGDMVTISLPGTRIQATGNHPFFVKSGDGLASRPPARDVPPAERTVAGPGRWVEARDIEPGDLLMSPGGEVPVGNISVTDAACDVYNLRVDGTHTYTVGTSGVLVHNKGEGSDEPLIFRADEPFIFLIRDRESGLILFMGRVTDLGQ